MYQYLIPGMQSNPAAFVANTTLILGTYSKPIDARVQISVDYSQLVPVIAIQKYSFRVNSGGEPQLRIDGSKLNSTSNVLTFFVSGGIGGQAYEVTIVAKLVDKETRSDVLTVQVLDDGCSACVIVAPFLLPGGGGATSGDGSIITNTAPRFFISGTPPIGANILDQWYDTTTGQVFDYISNGVWKQWFLLGPSSGGGGSGGGGSFGIVGINPIHPDGTTTSFTLTAVIPSITVAVSDSIRLFVSVDGVWQQAGTQYTATSNFIQFAEAPRADANVFMLWFS